MFVVLESLIVLFDLAALVSSYVLFLNSSVMLRKTSAWHSAGEYASEGHDDRMTACGLISDDE
jgi:hypothetical protein